MGTDGLLGHSCVERGWRFHRLDSCTFFFDERSEYLVRVDDSLVEKLRMSAPPKGSLSVVLDALKRGRHEAEDVPDDGEKTVVSLRLLGVRVDVHCTHDPCADPIREFYSASLVSPHSSSPEVIVWCDTEGSDRYLFRSRPDRLAGAPLAGVSVQTLRSHRHDWTSTLPPVPALGVWPFKDRFAALHAAAVRTETGEGVLIAGDRGSGKSTTALLLSKRLGAEVLCDETAFVHCRTRLVEPFPHAVGVWRDGRKVQVPITETGVKIGCEPVHVSRLVFLERWTEGAADVRRLSRPESLRVLLPHHRDAGASMGDAMQTLLSLVERSNSWLVRYSKLDELADLVCELVAR